MSLSNSQIRNRLQAFYIIGFLLVVAGVTLLGVADASKGFSLKAVAAVALSMACAAAFLLVVFAIVKMQAKTRRGQ